MDNFTDDWLKDYDHIDEFANELMHKLNQRNQYPTNSQPFAKSDLHIKDLYRKFQQKVDRLQELLNRSNNLNQVTQREGERRQRLVDNLKNRSKQIENLINNPDCDKSIQSTASETPTVGWNELDMESGPNDSQSVTNLRETQKLLLEEQDKGLDTLGTIISRQKHLAQGINTEINLHNEILDDIADAMVDTDERLLRNTRNIRVVDRKTNTCGYWTVIILLLIAIVVVAVVPN